ncbi:MFS transporter [Pseudonocardia sp.]|uniref:MFS transporter n=1 Tax=Pseudonocardia sp. TaxID=60912 RepID=UPI003D147B03
MARTGSSDPREPRRRRRRPWVSGGGPEPVQPPVPEEPPAWGERRPDARPAAAPYEPTVHRRYPWHDDPGYDPAAYRRGPRDDEYPTTPAEPRPPAGPAGDRAGGTVPAPPRRPAPPPQGPPVGARPPAPPRAPAPPRTPARGMPLPPPTPSRGLPPLPTPPRGTRPEPDATTARPAPDHTAEGAEPTGQQPGPKVPRKLTVTRVAAMRTRQFAQGGIRTFHRAATADGADRSGLTALTYATMMTYAVDAAVTVALANTLFFAAATAESKTNVALYLAITVAPFAVVAPVIGPLLDRLQRGRRAALAVSFAGRAILAVVMALNYENWLLYPAALGTLVLSKSYMVLKAAVTPRVLPETIGLTTTNSRLTTFGLVAGGVFGAVAAGVAWAFGSPGALFYTAGLAVVGVWLCVRIPRWVEVTAGEVPAALRSTHRGRRRPMGRGVLTSLWGNGSIRILTGFLALFVAFVVKAQTEADPSRQLFLIGIVGAAAGAGGFIGNFAGSRASFGRADAVVLGCIGAVVCSTVVAAVIPGIWTAAIVGLVGSAASALAKVSLDAVIQRDLPEESRASAFGRSETVLQLAWVFGGAFGVLLPHSTFWIGFVVVSCLVTLSGTQTFLISRGRTLIPGLGAREARVDTPPMAPTAHS